LVGDFDKMKNKTYDNKYVNSILAIVGDNIRKARGGMTQEKLASLAHVSRNTIWKIESGENITLESLINIAKALNVHPSELLMKDGESGETKSVEKYFRDLIREEIGDLIQCELGKYFTKKNT